MVKVTRAMRCAVVAMVGTALVQSASGGTLNVAFSNAQRAASAEFKVVGTDLIVTLTNTSTFDVLVPNEVLTAVFFDFTPPPVPLTRISAVVAGGSTVFFGGTDPGGVVGGEWAYKPSLIGAPGNAGLGVSSAGFNLFGPGDLFPGTNLQGPSSPDGIQYGITSAGDNPLTGNTPVTGTNALIQNSVIFTLSGVPVNFDPMARIFNVSFQYGTALEDVNLPAPGAVGLLACGGLALTRRRRA